MEAVDPGKIHSIQLENTSKDSKQAWFLDKATIKMMPSDESEQKVEEGKDKDESVDETKSGDTELVYLCQRWVGMADAKTDELKNAEAETTLMLQGVYHRGSYFM